ncbi:response regulator receiver protein [Paraburkholderia sp. Tr-20389]|uniref:response regulator receiver protein n=1 Tax=Paraburkholderia sp. Tr-20389 TaxID=2703903 RepID=UPI00197DE390|nr:response regulator receiver protein [Paraburkholderia sp. Tr-20389]MBN3752328.1 response regulator receiver protein [Paraburkholderia sp. Tr-20389]
MRVTLPSRPPPYSLCVGRPETGIVPYALVFLDKEGAGSPNLRSCDPSSYVAQAVTLNRSMLAAGLPQLTVVTNAIDAFNAHLSHLAPGPQPSVTLLRSTTELPKGTTFYASHFKLDLLEQVAPTLPQDRLLLLLDTDIIAQCGIDADLLRRCAMSGVGAFDISDQEFFAYGADRVAADLESVAGRSLRNPRWYGGEFLLASRGFIDQLVPVARECFERYQALVRELHHQGDEAFVSAAMNILSDEGHEIIDVGPYRAIGRHWSGNTHRDLRWFRNCAFVHLPDCKTMLAREASRRTFCAARIWRQIVFRHEVKRPVWALKLRLPSHRRRDTEGDLLDVLLLDRDATRLSSLARPLATRGLIVMCVDSLDSASAASGRLRPRVIVIGNPLSAADMTALVAREHGSSPTVIGYASNEDVEDWAMPDRFFSRSTDVSVVVDAVVAATAHATN